MKKDILWDQMKDNVVKTKNKPPIWEWFIPPILMVIWRIVYFFNHII